MYNESLSSNSNYPPMSQSDWDNAPFNQSDQDSVDVDVCASVTLSKKTTIQVDDYTAEEWDDWEVEDGENVHTRGINYDFSDCNFLEAFKEQYYTIPELIEILMQYLKSDIKGESHHERFANELLNSCMNWIVDEEEVIED